MAAAPEIADISNALQPLRSVVDSLRRAAGGQMPQGPERRKLVRCVRTAGNAAMPSLLRAFCSPTETESSWAYYLLARLGGERVVGRIGALLEDPAIADEIKARALGLLSDLEAPVPVEVRLRDPEALLERSVLDLLSSLEDEGELRQAIELIREQVPEAELPPFAAELLRHGGKRAERVLAALRAESGLAKETQEALAQLGREAGGSPSSRAAASLMRALERGLEYLEAGRPKAARRRLERFVTHHPENAEGRSALGVCLLQLDQLESAVEHLREAARLEPDEPLHRWNLAAAAKHAERLGGAYLALRDYLTITDTGEGASERRKEARRFVRAYERMLRDTHPGVPLGDYLRGEELFARAHAALEEGRPDEAAAGFEQVLALVPRHYPSWGNLGAAYLALDRKIEAQRCFEHALELNPDYQIARENLAMLATLS